MDYKFLIHFNTLPFAEILLFYITLALWYNVVTVDRF